MRTVFSVAIELREKLDCVGVVVDAKPGAETYYSRLGSWSLKWSRERWRSVRRRSQCFCGCRPSYKRRYSRRENQIKLRTRVPEKSHAS